jgi:hypothetical protein
MRKGAHRCADQTPVCRHRSGAIHRLFLGLTRAQVPTYLKRNKAAIADEQRQIDTFLRIQEQAVRRVSKHRRTLLSQSTAADC